MVRRPGRQSAYPGGVSSTPDSSHATDAASVPRSTASGAAQAMYSSGVWVPVPLALLVSIITRSDMRPPG